MKCILGAIARYGAFYGRSSGPIFLSNLHCAREQFKLLDCARDMYAVRFCTHYEDAGVKCQGNLWMFLFVLNFFHTVI